MQISTKLGIASLAMMVLSGVLTAFELRVPLAFLAGFLACVLGAFAAQRGTKWWLAIPGCSMVLFLFVLIIAFHAV
jgi:hypothetical protein